jgi:hypothetical protein
LFRFRKKKETVKKAEKKTKKNRNNLTWAGSSGGATRAGRNLSRNERELGFPLLNTQISGSIQLQPTPTGNPRKK